MDEFELPQPINLGEIARRALEEHDRSGEPPYRELPSGAIHVDVCPGCGDPDTWHPLDAPHHCQCRYGRDEYISAVYVPYEG